MILSVDQISHQIARAELASLDRVLVLTPSFKRMRAAQGSVWATLAAMFEGSEWLGSRLKYPTYRSQGRLVVLMKSAAELDDLSKMVIEASSHDRHKTYFGALRGGVAETKPLMGPAENSGLWNDIADAHYVASQAARMANPGAHDGWLTGDQVRTVAMHLRTKAAAGALSQLADQLFAIPLDGRKRSFRYDPLTDWYESIGNWPKAGFTVLTDIRNSKQNLLPDLRELCSGFLEGKLPYEVLIGRARGIRELHTFEFDEHLEFIRASEPRLFAASGDGLVGFVADADRLMLRVTRAGQMPRTRLTSGVAVGPVLGQREKIASDLDWELLVSKSDVSNIIDPAPTR